MHSRIHNQGHLDPGCKSRIVGVRIEQREAGITLLVGTLPDQGALHGMLLQLIWFGLVLLSFETSQAEGA